jgi:hypothetical protein
MDVKLEVLESQLYDCKICHTIEVKKYTPKGFDLCRDCKLTLQNKSYKCKNCGEEKREAFSEGRFTTCKKCRNKKYLEYRQDIRLIEKEPVISDDIRTMFNKYIKNDFTFMNNGYTIKECIESLFEKSEKLENLCKDIQEDYKTILKKQDETQRLLNQIIIHLNISKNEYGIKE